MRREARDNKTERDGVGGRRGTKGDQQGGEWVARGEGEKLRGERGSREVSALARVIVRGNKI